MIKTLTKAELLPYYFPLPRKQRQNNKIKHRELLLRKKMGTMSSFLLAGSIFTVFIDSIISLNEYKGAIWDSIGDKMAHGI